MHSKTETYDGGLWAMVMSMLMGQRKEDGHQSQWWFIIFIVFVVLVIFAWRRERGGAGEAIGAGASVLSAVDTKLNGIETRIDNRIDNSENRANWRDNQKAIADTNQNVSEQSKWITKEVGEVKAESYKNTMFLSDKVSDKFERLLEKVCGIETAAAKEKASEWEHKYYSLANGGYNGGRPRGCGHALCGCP